MITADYATVSGELYKLRRIYFNEIKYKLTLLLLSFSLYFRHGFRSESENFEVNRVKCLAGEGVFVATLGL